METAEVGLPPNADPRRVEEVILGACKERGLAVSVRTSLRSYPGSIHWHFKKEGDRGVLELTYWGQKRRLWINVHSNRAGTWTSGAMAQLKRDLEMRLASER